MYGFEIVAQSDQGEEQQSHDENSISTKFHVLRFNLRNNFPWQLESKAKRHKTLCTGGPPRTPPLPGRMTVVGAANAQ